METAATYDTYGSQISTVGVILSLSYLIVNIFSNGKYKSNFVFACTIAIFIFGTSIKQAAQLSQHTEIVFVEHNRLLEGWNDDVFLLVIEIASWLVI